MRHINYDHSVVGGVKENMWDAHYVCRCFACALLFPVLQDVVFLFKRLLNIIRNTLQF